MKEIKFFGLFFILFSFQILSAQEVTDYDLKNFAKSYIEMTKTNLKAQKEMAEMIEKEDLDLEVYHAIDESKNSDYEPDVSEDEYAKYKILQPKISKIQKELEEDVEKIFLKNDLTKQKYAAISERVKQDYLLQAKLEKILERMR